MKTSNSLAAILAVTKKLSVKMDSQSIADELLKHPDYPSLLAISDVLHNFHISNAAINLPFENLKEIPIPFIAHTNSNGGIF